MQCPYASIDKSELKDAIMNSDIEWLEQYLPHCGFVPIVILNVNFEPTWKFLNYVMDTRNFVLLFLFIWD